MVYPLRLVYEERRLIVQSKDRADVSEWPPKGTPR